MILNTARKTAEIRRPNHRVAPSEALSGPHRASKISFLAMFTTVLGELRHHAGNIARTTGPAESGRKRKKEKEKAMKDRTQQLLDTLEKDHDWQEGAVYSGGGMVFRSTDTCRICSLRRHYHSDVQNGDDGSYRFSDGETDEDLSLRQAVDRGC